MRITVSTIVFVLLTFAIAVSCTGEKDTYLRTLTVETKALAAVDSINIDRFDLFQASGVVRLDNGWLVLSSVKGDYKLLFLNPSTSEHFFAIRKGRGPGEMLNGSRLHKYQDGAALYDYTSATCIKVGVDTGSGTARMALDTIAVFKGGALRPVYMTTCGSEGFISGNVLDDTIWYSYYDRKGRILSNIEALELEAFSIGGDMMISNMLSSFYVSNPEGTRVCVANVASPSLSFSMVESGKLSEYRRYANEPMGIVDGRITRDSRDAFSGMDADDRYVYLLYSGNKIFDDVLPVNECIHLIVYDWDGNFAEHYLLDRNVSSVHVNGNELWCTSTYPESCVYRFVLD